jgi:hypothetical protein
VLFGAEELQEGFSDLVRIHHYVNYIFCFVR